MMQPTGDALRLVKRLRAAAGRTVVSVILEDIDVS